MKERSKNELLFRKAFIPWYDTELAMVLTLAFAVVVLLFSMVGVAATLDTPRYGAYIWIPCLLGLFALTVIVSTLVRMVRRGDRGGP